MNYEGYKTFQAEPSDGVLTVTIDFPPVNLQGQEMLADLNSLAMRLEYKSMKAKRSMTTRRPCINNATTMVTQ